MVERIVSIDMLITEQNSRVLYCGVALRQIVMVVIIPLTITDSDSSIDLQSGFLRHYSRLAKPRISPVVLNQPSIGRDQGKDNVVIIILIKRGKRLRPAGPWRRR